MKILVFDTETTGLPETKIINPDTLYQWPTIVQFSYIIFDTSINDIVFSKDCVIKVPDNIIISPESEAIHKINNQICSTMGVSINEVLTEFFYHLRSIDLIVGHNISFDINMVKVELLRIIYQQRLIPRQLKLFKYDLHFISNYKNICCTLQDSITFCNIEMVSKYGKPYLKYPKLSELHQKLFDNTPNHLHNSFNDILVTLRCYMKLKHDIDLLDNCVTFQTVSKTIY